MNDDQLDQLLRRLPRSITPPNPPWPGVARRLEGRNATRTTLVRIAAAVVIFTAGAIAGRLIPLGGSAEVAERSAFLAAVDVQGAGTAYVEAVAGLTAIPVDDPARAQATEAARVALAAADRAVRLIGE